MIVIVAEKIEDIPYPTTNKMKINLINLSFIISIPQLIMLRLLSSLISRGSTETITFVMELSGY